MALRPALISVRGMPSNFGSSIYSAPGTGGRIIHGGSV